MKLTSWNNFQNDHSSIYLFSIDTHLVGWKKVEVIWRVCDHISFARSVWPCTIVAEPKQKRFAPFLNFPFLLLMFRFLQIVKLHFCVAKLSWFKDDTLQSFHQKFLPKISKEICATLLKMEISFAFVDWTFPNNLNFYNKRSMLLIWIYCANM